MDTMNDRSNFQFSLLGKVVLIAIWLCQATVFCYAEPSIRLLTIDHAYEMAMETNRQILIAKKEIKKGKLLPKKAQTTMLPRISADGGYRQLDDPIAFEAQVGNITLPPIVTVQVEQWTASLNITQPIYEGKYFPLKKIANHSLENTTEAYYQTVQSVLFQVAQAYYGILKVKALIALEDYQSAIVVADTALSLDANAINYYYHGVVSEYLLKPEQAETDYVKSVGIDRNFIDGILALARIRLQLGKLDLATNHCENALRLDNRNTEAYWIRSEIHIENLDYPSAINDLSKNILIDLPCFSA